MNNLLIIGAGGHGIVIKEIAEDTGAFEKIDFIDDNSDLAIGKTSDLNGLHTAYDSAFVSIGNNEFRSKLLSELKQLGYSIPVLIHPTAYVSKSCEIKCGTVIEPKAIVNANASIGEGCIISAGAIVDHNAVVNDYCHINSGAVVKAGTEVKEKTKIDAGQVVD